MSAGLLSVRAFISGRTSPHWCYLSNSWLLTGKQLLFCEQEPDCNCCLSHRHTHSFSFYTAFFFPTLQSGDANLFATSSNRLPLFLFVEGYNPRIILRSERLYLQYLACIAALKMFRSWLNVHFLLLPSLAQMYVDNLGIAWWCVCQHIHAVIFLGRPLSLLMVTFHWWVIKPEK